MAFMDVCLLDFAIFYLPYLNKVWLPVPGLKLGLKSPFQFFCAHTRSLVFREIFPTTNIYPNYYGKAKMVRISHKKGNHQPNSRCQCRRLHGSGQKTKSGQQGSNKDGHIACGVNRNTILQTSAASAYSTKLNHNCWCQILCNHCKPTNFREKH